MFYLLCLVFFFKQKTAYEMRISDWSSDVCSSDLLEMIGAPVSLLQSQYDASTWAERGEILAAIFAQRDLADWVALLEGTDTCFAPVLRLSEVADHPHMKARSAYISKNGRSQCAPAPRFSRTPGRIQDAKVADELFVEWGAASC